jgi:GNAT superfamily N-acetyltransferase
MGVVIREARAGDAGECGRICYEAFRAIAGAHNFPSDFPTVEHATGLYSAMIGQAGCHAVVAEEDGRILGSNLLHEQDIIASVGPITVDPAGQNKGVGRQLMLAAMARREQRGLPGIRLVQAGYHSRSLALYTALGFETREHLSCLQGTPIGQALPGFPVRRALAEDLVACDALAVRVHGHTRSNELMGGVARGTATVVERNGRVTAYTSHLGYFGHACAETTEDLASLIASASALAGPGILVPSRNGALMRWCLAQGLRISQTMTLMTIGLYNEPAGAYLPSVLY